MNDRWWRPPFIIDLALEHCGYHKAALGDESDARKLFMNLLKAPVGTYSTFVRGRVYKHERQEWLKASEMSWAVECQRKVSRDSDIYTIQPE